MHNSATVHRMRMQSSALDSSRSQLCNDTSTGVVRHQITKRRRLQKVVSYDVLHHIVVSAAVCNSAGLAALLRSGGSRPGPGLGSLRAHVLIDELASRARPSSAVAVFEIEYCACVKISPSVWGILGDGTPRSMSRRQPCTDRSAGPVRG